MKKYAIILVLLGWLVEAHAQCDFKTIGHRGGFSYYYPENTLISLEHGFMENIFAAEIDVRFTADSVLILMHDADVERTTDGFGNVDQLPLSYIRTLDAGSWRGPEFKSTPVPTLNEALLLAEKYGKKLYLNMKVFVPQLIKQALDETGVPPDLILLDPDDPEKVRIYHEQLPGCPLVYFGEFPAPPDDPAFYRFLRDNGVVAVEIPAEFLHDAADDFYDEVHEATLAQGLEFWAYTVNDHPYLEYLEEYGIQGLETDRPAEVDRFFCDHKYGGFFPEKRVTGQWDFNQDLNGTIGSKLIADGDTSVAGQEILFGTTESFNLPSISNQEVNIARIPGFDPQHALKFYSNIAPEGLPGGLAVDNTYTLIFDLLKPAGRQGYTALFQTSRNNSDDADLFLYGTGNGMGVLEQYPGSFADSTWVRIAAVFDLYRNSLDLYRDGAPVGSVNLNNSVNGRFSINNNWGIQSSNLFSDDNGETDPLFVSSIQLRNYAMEAAEVRELGKPSAAKISSMILPDEEIPCPQFSGGIIRLNEGDTTILLADAGDRVNYQWEINSGAGWKPVLGMAFRNPATPALRIVDTPESYEGSRFRCVAFNGCHTLSDEFLFTNSSSAGELAEDTGHQLRIFPNPSTGLFTITLGDESEPFSLKISTMEGAEVLYQPEVMRTLQLRLSSGAYLVQVRTHRTSMVKKLLVID